MCWKSRKIKTRRKKSRESWDTRKNPNRKWQIKYSKYKTGLFPLCIEFRWLPFPRQLTYTQTYLSLLTIPSWKLFPHPTPQSSHDLNIWESIMDSMRVLLRVLVSYFENNQTDNRRKINSTVLVCISCKCPCPQNASLCPLLQPNRLSQRDKISWKSNWNPTSLFNLVNGVTHHKNL